MKIYRGYELTQAIAEGKIKEGSKFIFRYKDDYEDNVVWNGENICYIDERGYLLKDFSDYEFIYGTFELIEDEEIDIQNIEEINIEQVIGTDDKSGIALLHINKLIQAIKQLDKRTRKEKE